MGPKELKAQQEQHAHRVERIAEDVGRLIHLLCSEGTTESIKTAESILHTWYNRGYERGDRDGVDRCRRGWGFGGEPL